MRRAISTTNTSCVELFRFVSVLLLSRIKRGHSAAEGEFIDWRCHIPSAVGCLENTVISGHGTRKVPATLTSGTRVCSHRHFQFLVVQLGSSEFADSNEQSVGGPFLEPLGNPRGPVLFISQ